MNLRMIWKYKDGSIDMTNVGKNVTPQQAGEEVTEDFTDPDQSDLLSIEIIRETKRI